MRRNLRQLSNKNKDSITSIHDYTHKRVYNIYRKADDDYLLTLHSHRRYKRKLAYYKYAIRGYISNRCHRVESLRSILGIFLVSC